MARVGKKTELPEEPASPLEKANLGYLPQLLGFHMRLASTEVARDYAKSMAEVGLTQQQHAVLTLISENPKINQVDVADILGTDRVTMIAILDKLEARNLMQRERSKTDRRRQELQICPDGVQILEAAKDVIKKHERRFTKRFTPAELDALFAALGKIHQRGH
jgi:DNA-binding MarR family transcriptional regulator